MEGIPQHSRFILNEVEISSDFDSGNIAKACEAEPGHFHLWTGPDAMGSVGESSCRTWFSFKLTTPLRLCLKFTIKNLNVQAKLFKDGMRPVFKTDLTNWQRIPSQPSTFNNNGDFEVTFDHEVTEEITYFALTYPWSFKNHLDFINYIEKQCEANSIYFYAENAVNSLDGRPCHILTVSSYVGETDKLEMAINGLFPEANQRCKVFTRKKVVFISARVHPGEVPSSHVMNGFLKFIISSDERAKVLRDLFVFKIIPILNPDGVYRGYYRTDNNGANLNRYYNNPTLADHPTIYACKELFNYYSKEFEIFLYVDLHAHASKKGCFVFGNNFEFKDQLETCLFAKIMSENCINFDFHACDFSETSMKTRDRRDGLSKEGSGRVAFYKQTNTLRCYTLECNYNTGSVINSIENPEDEVTDISSTLYENGPPKYDITVYEDVGRAIAVSVLDLTGLNPRTRLRGLQEIRLAVASYIAGIIPFRFDSTLRKACKSIQDLEDYLTLKPKVEATPQAPKRAWPKRKRGKKELDESGNENFVVMKTSGKELELTKKPEIVSEGEKSQLKGLPIKSTKENPRSRSYNHKQPLPTTRLFSLEPQKSDI